LLQIPIGKRRAKKGEREYLKVQPLNLKAQWVFFPPGKRESRPGKEKKGHILEKILCKEKGVPLIGPILISRGWEKEEEVRILICQHLCLFPQLQEKGPGAKVESRCSKIKEPERRDRRNGMLRNLH